MYLDLLLFTIIWLVAQVAFHGFEAHVPFTKRLTKFVILGLLLFGIHNFIGRLAYYVVLAILAVAIGILHGYYFHYLHGIHWRKAEPRDEYLKLIQKMKSSR